MVSRCGGRAKTPRTLGFVATTGSGPPAVGTRLSWRVTAGASEVCMGGGGDGARERGVVGVCPRVRWRFDAGLSSDDPGERPHREGPGVPEAASSSGTGDRHNCAAASTSRTFEAPARSCSNSRSSSSATSGSSGIGIYQCRPPSGLQYMPSAFSFPLVAFFLAALAALAFAAKRASRATYFFLHWE